MTTKTKPSTEQADATIRALINRPYETPHDRPCWAFARDCLALRGIDLPSSPRAGLIRVVQPEVGRRLAAAIPNARFETLDGLGHMLMVTGARAVNERLAGFLGS